MAPPVRRAPTRKRAQQPTAAERVAAAQGQEIAGSTNGEDAFDASEAARELAGELDEMLRADPSFDEVDRQAFGEHFESALRDIVASGAYAEIPDESAWQESIDELKRHSSTSAEVDGLAGQIDGALASLERRETKIAVEFSRRLQVDGQESALAWFREQSASQEEEGATPQPVQDRDPGLALRADVIKSRSRRLRGPPRRS